MQLHQQEHGQGQFFRAVPCLKAVGRVHAQRRQRDGEQRRPSARHGLDRPVAFQQKGSRKQNFQHPYAGEVRRADQRAQGVESIDQRAFVVVQVAVHHPARQHPLAR